MQSSKSSELAYALLRTGFGIMLSLHGVTKLAAGKAEWIHLGEELEALMGFSLPVLTLGLLASVIQTLCGLGIAAGLFLRLSILGYLPIMLTAFLVLTSHNEPFAHYSHSLEIMIILACLYFIGPGKYRPFNGQSKT